MEKSENSRNKAQEFNEKLKELSEKLELKEKQTIIGIDFRDNIKLGGNLERNSVFVVKIKDEDETIHHIVIDGDINKIASIEKDGKIELSDRERQIWEQFIGTKGNQRLDQKKIYNLDQDYFLEEYKMHENIDLHNKLPQDKENLTKDKREKEVANKLGIKAESIICMIKIEDRETFGQAINKKLYADAYIVKYGNNKTKIMQSVDGKLKELTGIENSEFNSEVIGQLNLDKTRKNMKIKSGDLTTIKTEDERYNYVVVREKDPKKGIVIVNSSEDTKAYIFDDEGIDSIEELKTSITYTVEDKKQTIKEESKEKSLEKQEDEDEGRTPWGDAYARHHR